MPKFDTLQCQKEEPIKYVNICRFRLNCPKVEKVREPKEPLIKFKKRESQ